MRLENYRLRMGLNPNTVLGVNGDIYGSDRFKDGKRVNTSRVVEHVKNEYVKTRSGSIYELGNQLESPNIKRDYELYFLKKGADAIHQTGDISRDVYDAELIIVREEDEEFYIGNFVEGFGFIDVKFRKEDCRKATLEDLDMCDNGKMEDIVF